MDKDSLVKNSIMTSKIKLLHFTKLINLTSLFLEFIKRYYFILLINCKQLDTLNFTELNKIFQKYISLLEEIRSLFKINLSYENANEELLKHINEFTTYIAELDKDHLQCCVQFIFNQQQKTQFSIPSFEVNNLEKFIFDDYDCLIKQNCSLSQNQNTSETLGISHPIIESKYLKTLDKGFKVSVEHIQSPTEFYVFLDDINVELFEELQKKLKSIPVNLKVINIKKTLNNKVLLSEKLDDYVLYYSICLEKWFRAKILDWCLQYDDDLVSIFIIDTGETKCTSICYLQNMPLEIKNYPMFLKQCHLSDVCPVNNEKNDMKFTWMNNAVEQMRVWIETSKKITMKINSHHQSMFTESLPVTLWLFEEEKSVNQLLIENGLADKFISESIETSNILDSIDYKFTSTKIENWNPMKEDYEAYNNIAELNMLNPSTVIYGYSESDSSKLCQQFAKKGKCYKGKSCKQYHELLNPLGFTIEKEKIFINSIATTQKPHCNEEMEIEITKILDINKFCCTLKKSNSMCGFQEETLSNLNAYLNEAENIISMKKLVVPPAVGQIVITKCYGTNYWFRGQVIESEPENDQYKILLVDQGNMETVPIKRIRAIEPKYLHLPFQCVQCLIYGIENTTFPSSHEKGISYLENVMKKRNLIIKVVSILPGILLSLLVHLFDDKKNDIAKELVDHNFAKYRKEIVLDNNSKILPG